MNNLIIRADRVVSPFLMPFSPQRFTHRGAGVRFGDGIKVAVDIGGSGYQISSHIGPSRYFFSGGGVLSISL